jgi:hypothetical protein
VYATIKTDLPHCPSDLFDLHHQLPFTTCGFNMTAPITGYTKEKGAVIIHLWADGVIDMEIQ